MKLLTSNFFRKHAEIVMYRYSCIHWLIVEEYYIYVSCSKNVLQLYKIIFIQ